MFFHDLVVALVGVRLSSLSCACDCRRLRAYVIVVVFVRQVIVSSQYDFHNCDAAFICLWVIRNSKVYSIRNKKSN